MSDEMHLNDVIADYGDACAEMQAEIDRLRAELAATKEALKPFADLRVTRFMTDGLTYNFRIDAAWIRKARSIGGMEN